MLEYGGIYVSEGIDTNKPGGLRECIICHYFFILRINFKFQRKVCNGCHDMTHKSMSFDDVAIVTAGRNYYRILFWGMTKSEDWRL